MILTLIGTGSIGAKSHSACSMIDKNILHEYTHEEARKWNLNNVIIPEDGQEFEV